MLSLQVLQIKVEDGVIKELLGFQCFIVMFPNRDCIRITIRILKIRLHLVCSGAAASGNQNHYSSPPTSSGLNTGKFDVR
jgi:hypothetical protein